MRAGQAAQAVGIKCLRTANTNILCVDHAIAVDDFYTQVPFTTLPSLTHQS